MPRSLVDLRIYRATLVLVLLALVVVMFSLEERPPALSSTLAPDAFDEQGAFATGNEIMSRFPDRSPGGSGDDALADVVEGRLQNLRFETRRDEFDADFEGEEETMTNVVATLSGHSDRQLVVMAHRDSSSRPGPASASATGMLLELARAAAAVRHQKTMVFVSTDGGDAGHAGAQRFADEYDKSKVDAVLVLEEPAAAHAKRPFIVPWSLRSGRGSFQLQRTAEEALRRETGGSAGGESPAAQYLRQAWPLSLREQGPLVAAGYDAVTLTARDESSQPGGDSPASLSRLRMAGFGKAALGTLLALDSAELTESPAGYVVFGRQLLPEWALALLALSLLVPVIVTAVDAFARARRRGRPVMRWARWALANGMPFLLVLVVAWVFELLGWLPASASEALAPATRPSFSESAPALVALSLLFTLAWLALRPRLAGFARGPDQGEGPEAAVALSLVLAGLLLALWAGNPFAALLMIPALHLCLLTALPQGPNRRLLVSAAVVAALLLPAVVLLYYGARFDLGADPTRYLLLLVSGDGSPWDALLGSLIAGSLVSAVLVALARPGAEPESQITVRGPRSYAGPGSLGGTESALQDERGQNLAKRKF